ncbi:MAG: hypothetical protein LUD81_04820 [Clostridiales bacterium]|nr:hypothetical protein [Clostridiales bacterium]
MNVNGFNKTITGIVNQRLLDTHTAFIGKIISIKLNTMTIQPLNMYKIYGEKAVVSSVLTAVPVLMPYKFVYQVEEGTEDVKEIIQKELKSGDSVLCCVCERDITAAKEGNMTASSTGRHHNLSDSVVIMGLSEIEYVSGDEEE